MYNLSLWASKNKTAARLLFSILWIVLFISNCLLGIFLVELRIVLPEVAIPFLCLGLFILYFLMPEKSRSTLNRFKVTSYILLIGISSLVVIKSQVIGHSIQINKPVLSQTLLIVYQTSTEKNSFEKQSSKSSLLRKVVTFLWKKKIQHTGDPRGIATVLLILILLVIDSYALLGIFILGCNLSCNGYGFLATLALLGLTGTLVFLNILIIKAFQKLMKRQEVK